MKRVFLLAALVAIVAGCGGPGNSASSGGTGSPGTASAKVLRYPLPDNPTSLDPGIVQDGDTIDVLQQIYEGLVTWNEKNEVAPLLAESWTIEDGGKTYVFKLKKGVKFHNGREVTAADFKWTWERNLNPALKSQTAGAYMSDIVGATDIVNGKATELKGVTVVDDHTLKVTTDKPRPYFLGKMTYLTYAALPKESTPAEEFAETKLMVGTGPFTPSEYVPQAIIKLAANPNYHGGKPPLDSIERRVVKDAATRLNLFRQGQLDMLQVERMDVEALQKDEKLKDQLKFNDRPSIFYVGMNSGDAYPPFKDRRVRRAFAMAIDRDAIVKTYLGGINQAALGIVPPGVPGHREKPASSIPYNVEEAKKLLAEAGYPGGKGLPPIDMRFRQARKDISLVAEAVAAQLQENLGVTVKLSETPWQAYLERYNKGENGFFHMRWAADYLDPQNFLSHMLTTDGPENHIYYSNPEFDKLCAEADGIMDLNKRLELYAKAEDIVLQDAPWVPIYFQKDAELISPKVAGLRTSLFGWLPHTATDIK